MPHSTGLKPFESALTGNYRARTVPQKSILQINEILSVIAVRQ